MQIYVIEDLSNGLESRKLKVQNRFNFDSIAPFQYITNLEISESITNSFMAAKGCTCLNECDEECQCSQYSKDNSDGCYRFCNDSCLCTPETCSRYYNPQKCDYLVYFVNPEKCWGLRTLNSIKVGSPLFEYVGILSEDHNDVNFDDYIYTFKYNEKTYMIDAHEKGNLARFINHSCSPNCYTDLVQLEANCIPHLLIRAKHEICEGEELTLDYGKLWWSAKNANSKLKCVCNLPSCRYSDKNEISNSSQTQSPLKVKAKKVGQRGFATKSCQRSILAYTDRMLKHQELTLDCAKKVGQRRIAMKSCPSSIRAMLKHQPRLENNNASPIDEDDDDIQIIDSDDAKEEENCRKENDIDVN